MSQRLAAFLMFVAILTIESPSMAQDRPSERASPAPKGEGISPGPVTPRDVIVWEFRIGAASCALDAMRDGPRCIPPRPEREWVASYSIETYVAKLNDSTPRGYSHYGVGGLGAAHSVSHFRVGDRVFRFIVAMPMEAP